MTPNVEYIDVLTSGGAFTGQSVSRMDIHAHGLWHRTVHVWIVTSCQEVLLQKRAQNKTTHPGLWDIACAGHIASGESSVETAVKELKEELGIDFTPFDLTFLFTMENESIHADGRYIDREFHDIYLVRMDIPLSSFTLKADEVEALRYIPLKGFAELARRKDPSLVPHFSEYERICNLQAIDPANAVF